MRKQRQPPKFWKLASVQLVLVIACAATWFYFRTKALLAGPPIGDMYAYSWSFQSVVFVVFWLPIVLLLAGVLLAIEHRALKPHYQVQQADGTQHAP